MNDTKAPAQWVDDTIECRWCRQRFKTRRGYRHHRAAVRYGRLQHEDRREDDVREYDSKLNPGFTDMLKLMYSKNRLKSLFYDDSPLLRLSQKLGR
jgi:hypothetical protein